MSIDNMIALDGQHPLRLLTRLSEDQGKILLWQNIQGVERLCKGARIVQLNASNEDMTFYPLKGEFCFRHHTLIYFFCQKRTTIFKAAILHHSPFKLVIRLPQKIMMANSRAGEREDISETGRLVHYTHNSNGPLYHYSYLLDWSSQGLSFRSSINNLMKFKKGDRLWIRSPMDEKCLLEGEVRHMTKVDEKSGPYLRIGVKF